MKRQLLLIVALLATASLTQAVNFNYTQNRYNVPTAGLRVGDTFTISNINPKEYSPEFLTSGGTNWAQKTSSVYPYAGKNMPGLGTATFKVIAPATTATAAPGAPSTVAQRVGVMPAAAGQVAGRIAGAQGQQVPPSYGPRERGQVGERLAGQGNIPAGQVAGRTGFGANTGLIGQAPGVVTGQGAITGQGARTPQVMQNASLPYKFQMPTIGQPTGPQIQRAQTGQVATQGRVELPAGQRGILTEVPQGQRAVISSDIGYPQGQVAGRTAFTERPQQVGQQAGAQPGVAGRVAADFAASERALQAAVDKAKAAAQKLGAEARLSNLDRALASGDDARIRAEIPKATKEQLEDASNATWLEANGQRDAARKAKLEAIVDLIDQEIARR